MALGIAARVASGMAASLLALALLGVGAGVARAEPVVTVGSATVASGQSFVIPVSISGVTDPDGLGAYDFHIAYTASVIAITGCSSGTAPLFADPAACNPAQPGIVYVNDFHGAKPGPTGDMVLFTLSGSALGAAGQATDLSLTINNLGSTEANEFTPRTAVNGRISIVGADAPTMIPTTAPTVPPAPTLALPDFTPPPAATGVPSGSPEPSPTVATSDAATATPAASPAPGASPAATATATPRPPTGATATPPAQPTATPTPPTGETNWFLVGGVALLVVGGLALLVVLWRAVRR